MRLSQAAEETQTNAESLRCSPKKFEIRQTQLRSSAFICGLYRLRERDVDIGIPLFECDQAFSRARGSLAEANPNSAPATIESTISSGGLV